MPVAALGPVVAAIAPVAGSAPGVGLWGLWQVLQGMPPECSAGFTCGKSLGLAALAAWHRAHRTAVSGKTGVTEAGSAAWLASGPWQASQLTWTCLP